jgi:hypothetical protein
MAKLSRLRTAGLALCASLAVTGTLLTVGSAAPASAATCSPRLDLNVGFSGVLVGADATSQVATGAGVMTDADTASTAPNGWVNTCLSGVVYEGYSGSNNEFGCPYVIIFDVFMGCVPPIPGAFGSYGVFTIRSPDAPYHRIWFHQDVDGKGWAKCFYSRDNDITIPQQYVTPGNIQVTDNTASC